MNLFNLCRLSGMVQLENFFNFVKNMLFQSPVVILAYCLHAMCMGNVFNIYFTQAYGKFNIYIQ